MIAKSLNPQLSAFFREIECLEFCTETGRLDFSTRLAQDNGWMLDYAKRTVREHYRFLNMVRLGHATFCPSDAVSRAWLLHMENSTQNWSLLLKKIIQNPSIIPTTHSGERQFLFNRFYASTLIYYQEAFGAAPPDDIWPAAAG